MKCARCAGTPAEYFSAGGDPLCRTCYFAEQTAVQNGRAADEMRSAENASTLMRARLVWRGGWTLMISLLLVVAAFSMVGVSRYAFAVLAFAIVAGSMGFWRIYRMYR
jgi:hypothetical protein